LLLHITNNENIKISILTFDFWFEFKEILEKEEEIKKFEKYFSELVKILTFVNQIPKNYNNFNDEGNLFCLK
jgi:hypothetical protein